jgi:hypothetical protein
MSKSQLVETLCHLVGSSCRVIDPRDGWPGIIEVQLSTGWQRFSVHIGAIHSFSRKEYEYRFQNPGAPDRPPVSQFPGTKPLLLGIWSTDLPAVLVAAQPEVRMGDRTRFSILFPQRLFREAQEYGWAEPYRNSRDNLHWSFLPPLLPTFIELYESQPPLDSNEIQIAAVSSGLVGEPTDAAAAGRARQAAYRLVRSAEFGQKVVAAYDEKCAMCGINLGLVSGAHILPVSAPNSVDQVWNGVALCENHHRAFDRHLIWVEPSRRKLRIHPTVLTHGQSNERSRIFVESTFDELTNPRHERDFPRAEMFSHRYQYFGEAYDWVS